MNPLILMIPRAEATGLPFCMLSAGGMPTIYIHADPDVSGGLIGTLLIEVLGAAVHLDAKDCEVILRALFSCEDKP